jgi:ATP-dependent Clp protease ATP-binding subunit ClpC
MGGPLAERSQRVLGLARDGASRLHHEYIGTEHILLGIASESAGVASESLSSFGVTLDRVRSGVETIIGLGPPSASPDDRGVTPRAKRVIDFAQEEAAHRGSPRVEPEHLLLGVTREVQGVAAQVLRDLQVPPESVQEKVSGLLGRRDSGGPQDS